MQEEATYSNENDYSYVGTTARVAFYDDLKSAPRITKVEPAPTANFIENLTTCIYEQAQSAGGKLSYTVIREVTENFIHAQFKDIVVSILDGGNTIRFADQGPGIEEKEKAQKPGFTSATAEMTDYIRGVGSGLPIVRDYIDGMNGSLSIEDNLRAGAVVTISLKQPEKPVITTHQPIHQEIPLPTIPLTDKEKAILSLFSDEDILGITEISNTLGYSPSTVHSILGRMEQAGLIENGPGKKRHITDIGLQTAQRLRNS